MSKERVYFKGQRAVADLGGQEVPGQRHFDCRLEGQKRKFLIHPNVDNGKVTLGPKMPKVSGQKGAQHSATKAGDYVQE